MSPACTLCPIVFLESCYRGQWRSFGSIRAQPYAYLARYVVLARTGKGIGSFCPQMAQIPPDVTRPRPVDSHDIMVMVAFLSVFHNLSLQRCYRPSSAQLSSLYSSADVEPLLLCCRRAFTILQAWLARLLLCTSPLPPPSFFSRLNARSSCMNWIG